MLIIWMFFCFFDISIKTDIFICIIPCCSWSDVLFILHVLVIYVFAFFLIIPDLHDVSSAPRNDYELGRSDQQSVEICKTDNWPGFINPWRSLYHNLSLWRACIVLNMVIRHELYYSCIKHAIDIIEWRVDVWLHTFFQLVNPDKPYICCCCLAIDNVVLISSCVFCMLSLSCYLHEMDFSLLM